MQYSNNANKLCYRMSKLMQKFIWKNKHTRIAWKKKTQERPALLDIKTYHEVSIIKSVVSRHGNTNRLGQACPTCSPPAACSPGQL